MTLCYVTCVAEQDGKREEAGSSVAGRFFQEGSTDEVILTKETIESGVFKIDLKGEEPGRELSREIWLELNGRRMRLVGIIDGRALKSVRDLRGDSILPQELAARGNVEQLISGENAEAPEGSFSDMKLQDFVIVPFGTPDLGLETTSISVRLKASADVWGRMMELVRASDLRVYFGCTEAFAINPDKDEREHVFEERGAYYLKSGMGTSIGGLSSLLIPLFISATISPTVHRGFNDA